MSLEYLVVELLFLVGLSWQLSLFIRSSDVGAMLFSFQACLWSMQHLVLAGRIEWVSIRIYSTRGSANFLHYFFNSYLNLEVLLV